MRSEALPSDVAACRAASALVTTSGGLTSHAAVIARGLRLPAVVGCAQVRIDLRQRAVFGPHATQPIVREGEVVTVDAQRGLVYAGAIATRERIASLELRQLMQELRKLRPVALWAYGPAAPALATKEEACLDGIVCPLEDPERLPTPQGRECWVEVPAADVLALLPRIPPGWGIVVRAGADELAWSEVRRASRLRPLGCHLTLPCPHRPPPGLDLLIVSGHVGALEELSPLAARVLVAGDFSQIRTGIGHSSWSGLLCRTERTLACALELASVRPHRPSLT
jgi:phosphohistidine swiveling domain-containing protein